MTDQQASQYTGEVFASERFGKKRLIRMSQNEVVVLESIISFWQKDFGVDIDLVREEISLKLNSRKPNLG